VNRKVVVQPRNLPGSIPDVLGQGVAAISLHRDEHGRYVPPTPLGDALGWVGPFRVQQSSPENIDSEISDEGARGVSAIDLLQEDLDEMRRDAQSPANLDPQGLYCGAQICLQGHVRSSEGYFERGERCTKCGAACIDECQYCRAPIRGRPAHSPVLHYDLPFFCHSPECGHPYPWMQDKLETARELLYDLDNLSLGERDQVWELLKVVMSDPNSEWAEAKTELIGIKLAKVSRVSRDVLLDFTAKVAAAVMKSKP